MAIVKSKLIKYLKKSYPNFLTKDLEKLVNIILNEIKKTQTNIGKPVTIKWKVALRNNYEEEGILEEEYDSNYEPTQEEIIEYAEFLGMNLSDPIDKVVS